MEFLRKVAIVQVRTSSTRLPKKCLLKIFGRTVLEHIICRVKSAKSIDEIYIATTTDSSDDCLEEIAELCKVKLYRGSENDVLDRFYQVAKLAHADIICRITADDPFKDPIIIDQFMEKFLDASCDYVSNTLIPTYPEGIDIEIFSMQALEKAWREAKKNSEREHVTPYIWKNQQIFKVLNIKNEIDLSNLRWTLDNAIDWVFVQQVYDCLYEKTKIFLMKDILELIEKYPYLKEFNKNIVRNEGYLKSIEIEKN